MITEELVELVELGNKKAYHELNSQVKRIINLNLGKFKDFRQVSEDLYSQGVLEVLKAKKTYCKGMSAFSTYIFNRLRLKSYEHYFINTLPFSAIKNLLRQKREKWRLFTDSPTSHILSFSQESFKLRDKTSSADLYQVLNEYLDDKVSDKEKYMLLEKLIDGRKFTQKEKNVILIKGNIFNE
jgi:DNA-directed RNA polymerase specialized sigma subunit